MSGVTHEELQSALARADITVDAAEAHGWLCGALCTRERYGAKEWLAELAAENDRAAPTPDAELRHLPEQVLESLRSAEFEFAPLLPPDRAPLAERVAALAAWCNGFLYGAGTGAPARAIAEAGDVGECLQDLADIARAELEPGREADEGERDFAELFEFVRAGAQLTFDELAGSRADATG